MREWPSPKIIRACKEREHPQVGIAVFKQQCRDCVRVTDLESAKLRR